MKDESSPNNEEEKDEKKNNDSSIKNSTKKTNSNNKNNNYIQANKTNADIFAAENLGFDLDKYFQDQESFVNYQDNFPHEDIDLLLHSNAQQTKLSNSPTKSQSLNNKISEGENQLADAGVNESPNHKEKNVDNNDEQKIINTKRKRGRPKNSPERRKNEELTAELEEKEPSTQKEKRVIKVAMEKNQTERPITEFLDKNDKHTKEIQEKRQNESQVVDQNDSKKTTEKHKNYESNEKESPMRENRNRIDDFKFETPKRSFQNFQNSSSSSNDRIPFVERYIQNFREDQNIHQNRLQNSIGKKTEYFPPPESNMGRFRYQPLNFSPPKSLQSSNIAIKDFHKQDNMRPLNNMNQQNQYFDQLNYEDNFQNFQQNCFKLDQYNQPNSLNNYETINQIQQNSLNGYDTINQIQPNSLNSYDTIKQIQPSSLNNFDIIKQIQQRSVNNYDSIKQFQPSSLNNYDSIKPIQSYSLNNYDSIKPIQSYSLNNYDSIKQIQSSSLNNYDSIKQIQPNSLNNYVPNSYSQFYEVNNETKHTIYPNENSDFDRKLLLYDKNYSDLSSNKEILSQSLHQTSGLSSYKPSENQFMIQPSSLNIHHPTLPLQEQTPLQQRPIHSPQFSSIIKNGNPLMNESFQTQIEIQNKLQQNIEEIVLSIAVYEPSFIREAMANDKLILNPFQLKFEPQSFWIEVHDDFTFGSLIKKFFRLKNSRIAKFIYKLYDMLLITTKLPFYKGIVGISWVTDRIFILNVQLFASLIDIPYLQIDSALFGPNGHFTVLGFAEVTPHNFHEAGLGSFPDITEPNFKLMFHIDLKFINTELNTQTLDDIDNHYQLKIHSRINNVMNRPRYPAFS